MWITTYKLCKTFWKKRGLIQQHPTKIAPWIPMSGHRLPSGDQAMALTMAYPSTWREIRRASRLRMARPSNRPAQGFLQMKKWAPSSTPRSKSGRLPRWWDRGMDGDVGRLVLLVCHFRMDRRYRRIPRLLLKPPFEQLFGQHCLLDPFPASLFNVHRGACVWKALR